MHRSIALVATIGCSFLLSSCATHAPEAGLVVSNVTVVSPERPRPLERAFVRIMDGRIAEVSERPLRGTTEIDGTGRYLIPGLIDGHVHLAVPPGFPAAMTSQQAAAHPDIVAAALAQDPKSYLFFGFTTVIDLIGTAERTALWNARELRPDAYFCGGAALIQGQVRYVLTPFFSYGWPDDRIVPPVTDPALNTPEAVAGHMAADGAACVKTFYAGRGPKPTTA